MREELWWKKYQTNSRKIYFKQKSSCTFPLTDLGVCHYQSHRLLSNVYLLVHLVVNPSLNKIFSVKVKEISFISLIFDLRKAAWGFQLQFFWTLRMNLCRRSLNQSFFHIQNNCSGSNTLQIFFIPNIWILGSRVLDKDLPFCLSKNRLLIELVKVQKSRRRKGKRDQKRDLDPFSSFFLFSLCNMFFLGTSIIFPFCKLLQNLIG